MNQDENNKPKFPSYVIGDISYLLSLLSKTDWKAQVIIADCPWNYDADFGYKGGNGAGSRLDITPKYDKMTIEQLCNMGPLIQEVADPNACLLYMWSTNGFDEEVYNVARTWGFRYMRTQYTWVKSFAGAGTGRISRHDTEHVKMFFRGKGWVGHDLKAMKAHGEKLSSTAFMAKRPRNENGHTVHSAKPDNIHSMIEREHTYRYKRINKDVLPENPSPENWETVEYLNNRLELFGRMRRSGWTVLGNGK